MSVFSVQIKGALSAREMVKAYSSYVDKEQWLATTLENAV